MKCYGCDYEQKEDEYQVQEIKFTHGKNKGKIKDTRKVLVQSYEKFIPVRVMGKLDFTKQTDDHYGRDEDVSVYACPKCGTLRLGGWQFS